MLWTSQGVAKGSDTVMLRCTQSLDEFPLRLDNPPGGGMAFGAGWSQGGGRLVAIARTRDSTAWLLFGGRHPIQVRKERMRRERVGASTHGYKPARSKKDLAPSVRGHAVQA
ncbi:hypothetical protein CBOM_05753 [Ceraceosorus bombacis]|uniref:Uncharacterized protein n=1 Tax=Ceraceosorus bombacis TaxID=401625 RepID=A0A0N7LBD4_9BASI|nr:hypothetical protein CBOM_05753 [Ceraceosorus bombacis]